MSTIRRPTAKASTAATSSRSASAGLLGLTLPELPRGSRRRPRQQGRPQARRRPRASSCVWLAGGPATIDMWDLKPDAPEGIRGEFKPIDTSAAGVQISRAPAEDGRRSMDKVTIVRSLYHTIPSHGPATVFMTTGNKPTPALQYPSLGSLAAKLLPAEAGVPPYVTFGELRNGTAGAGRLPRHRLQPVHRRRRGGGGKGGKARGQPPRPRHHAAERLHPRRAGEPRRAAARTSTTASRQLDKSNDLVDGLDTFHQQALEILRSDKTKKAFDLTPRSRATRDALRHHAVRPGRAGGPPAGRGRRPLRHRQPRRLGHARPDLQRPQDPPAAAARPDAVGPDRGPRRPRHARQHDRLCAPASSAARRRSTRTPAATTGRGRWRCVLAGGGFKRGYAHGTTDASGMAPATEPCTPDDVAATIFHQLGIDPHHGTANPDRPAGPAVPRGQGDREA